MAYFIESLCPVLKALGKENKPVKEELDTHFPSYTQTVQYELGRQETKDLGTHFPSSYTRTLQHGLGRLETKYKRKVETSNSKQPVGKINRGLFTGLQIVLQISASEESKLKAGLRKNILENGGQISYIVTKDSNFVVGNEADITQAKLKAAARYAVPVVSSAYIEDCLAEKELLPFESYLLEHKITSQAFVRGKIALSNVLVPNTRVSVIVQLESIDESVLKDYSLVKYVLLKGQPRSTISNNPESVPFATIEIHTQSSTGSFCVYVSEGMLCTGKEIQTKRVGQFVKSASEATFLYTTIYHKMTGPPSFLRISRRPLSSAVGSEAFQILQNRLSEDVDQRILLFVSSAWNEMHAVLTQYMKTSYYPEWKVREAEGILIQIVVALSKKKENLANMLSKEFYSLLNFLQEHSTPLTSPDNVLNKLEVCKILSNISALSENANTVTSTSTIYMNLKCQVALVDPQSPEFEDITKQLLNSQRVDSGLVVRNVFSVKRNLESANFDHSLPNLQYLYHGTSSSNVLGILLNGLSPPTSTLFRVYNIETVEDHVLGYGIYFSDSVNGCLRFCGPSTRGSRFVLVCKVALGKVFETCVPETTFVKPPVGYDSVLGVRSKAENPTSSFFPENEFVIYKENQQELCYIVEFSDGSAPEGRILESSTTIQEPTIDSFHYNVDDTLMEGNASIKSSVCGLTHTNSTSDKSLALEITHFRARIVDLVVSVTVLQVYRNNSDTTAEVQYTFPLSGGAAVCGFEAFIGNKHVVGEVKEKETAHREYKEAVNAGHGAYLLDEDKGDVFTARLGNVPAKTQVIIKITYITELAVDSDTLKITIPASMCSGSNSEMQTFTFQACIEMATNILKVFSPTHPTHVKQTDTKAVVKLPNYTDKPTDFVLAIQMSEVHVPRMWCEEHPDHKTEVCMVSFYPEFEVETDFKKAETLILLDASNSMRGESFQTALNVAVLCIKNFNEHVNFNLIVFGSMFVELFPESQVLNAKTKLQAIEFLENTLPEMGMNDLTSPLSSCNLFHRFNHTNVFLISDGYFDSENQLCRFVSSLNHVRLFTLAVGDKSNRHFLKRSARVSGGSYDEFSTNEKPKWEIKLKDLILKSAQPSLSDIKIEWQLFDQDGISIAEAPKKVKNVFSGTFLIAYGFVNNCTMATLKAKVMGRVYETVVSSHKLSQTNGTLLHSLAAKALIADWETGILDDTRVLQVANKENIKESIVSVAKQYNLVTSLTSFIAVEKRSEGENIERNDSILKDLLNVCDVDILPYMSYEPDLPDAYTHGEPVMMLSLSDKKRSEVSFTNTRLITNLQSLAYPLQLNEPKDRITASSDSHLFHHISQSAEEEEFTMVKSKKKKCKVGKSVEPDVASSSLDLSCHRAVRIHKRSSNLIARDSAPTTVGYCASNAYSVSDPSAASDWNVLTGDSQTDAAATRLDIQTQSDVPSRYMANHHNTSGSTPFGAHGSASPALFGAPASASSAAFAAPTLPALFAAPAPPPPGIFSAPELFGRPSYAGYMPKPFSGLYFTRYPATFGAPASAPLAPISKSKGSHVRSQPLVASPAQYTSAPPNPPLFATTSSEQTLERDTVASFAFSKAPSGDDTLDNSRSLCEESLESSRNVANSANFTAQGWQPPHVQQEQPPLEMSGKQFNTKEISSSTKFLQEIWDTEQCSEYRSHSHDQLDMLMCDNIPEQDDFIIDDDDLMGHDGISPTTQERQVILRLSAKRSHLSEVCSMYDTFDENNYLHCKEKTLEMLEEHSLFKSIVNVLLTKAVAGKKLNTADHSVFEHIEEFLGGLGGGLPLCSMILRMLRSESGTQSKVADILNSDENISDDCMMTPDPLLNDLIESGEAFVEMLENTGLKSMGSSIYESIVELSSLLFALYFYILRCLLPLTLAEQQIPLNSDCNKTIARSITNIMIQSLELDDKEECKSCDSGSSDAEKSKSYNRKKSGISANETKVMIAGLKRVDKIDKKYPLIYSTLNIGRSWESAVFKAIRDVI